MNNDSTKLSPTKLQNYSYDDIINRDILELMGAQNMPEEKKKELYTKIIDTIQNRVITRIADELSEPDLQQWKKLAEEGNKDKMEEFLKSKNIDLKQLMFQEALFYKSELATLSNPKTYQER